MGCSSKTTIKDIAKRLDTLVQTVQRSEGCFICGTEWCSKCVTCGKTLPITGKTAMQGGHFIPRGCRITRWEAMNVHPQCSRCNGFLDGNYIMYSRWMMKTHPEEYEQLMSLFDKHKKGTAPKLTVMEVRALYNSWLKKGRELEAKTGLKLFPKSWNYVIV
jgi:hypothetical protein